MENEVAMVVHRSEEGKKWSQSKSIYPSMFLGGIEKLHHRKAFHSTILLSPSHQPLSPPSLSVLSKATNAKRKLKNWENVLTKLCWWTACTWFRSIICWLWSAENELPTVKRLRRPTAHRSLAILVLIQFLAFQISFLCCVFDFRRLTLALFPFPSLTPQTCAGWQTHSNEFSFSLRFAMNRKMFHNKSTTQIFIRNRIAPVS